MKAPDRKRCAIYTRKSSEEGLEQAFNSLDAQREACAAYIKSQTSEGWDLTPGDYDDGGYSGGSMERPALLRLLANIDRGRIDVVVVYKVDRLTRSLADFARIVECLEAKGASFVSVTQAFNTTTSMGRLTLNVLLSFAQFEREVTGERIRDKIAASKARGLWMGGRPMLGYKPTGRTLEIDPSEAETVRFIFQRYLDLGSVHTLQGDLRQRGIRAKSWTTVKGKAAGGGVLARGALYHMLRNRIYAGEIVHKTIVHPGKHRPIIDAALFAEVQARLDQNAKARRERPLHPGGSPLTGLIFDDAGQPMSPVHARGKSGKPHRYYVSKARLTGCTAQAGSLARIPARAIEDLVADRIERLLAPSSFSWPLARTVISRITIRAKGVEIRLSKDVATALELLPAGDRIERSGESVLTLIVAMHLGRRGGAMRMLDPSGRRVVDRAAPDAALVRAVARGWRWRNQLLRGDFESGAALATAEGLTLTSVHRLVRLAYLAPDILEDILDGRQRPGLTIEQLCRSDFPLAWDAQRRLVGAQDAP